jgi:hypothetical protein
MRTLTLAALATVVAGSAMAQSATYYVNPRTGQFIGDAPRKPYYPPAGTGTIYTTPQYEAQTGVNRYYWNGQSYRALGPHDTGGLVMGR